MGVPVILYGKSGSGKSRSLKNFAKDEIVFVNVERKLLPFRSKFEYELKSDDVATIKKWLLKMPTKSAVIDDAGYIMTNQFMTGHSAPKSGSSSFDLFNDIADSFWGLIEFVKNNLPEDVIVYIVLHESTNDYGDTKLRTIGKLLDEKVCIEGMTTIVIRCMSENGRHFFKVRTDGSDITKSPEDMFEETEIENDLKAVDTAIRDYYGLNIKKEIDENEEN